MILYLQANLVDSHSINYGLTLITINMIRLYVVFFLFEYFSIYQRSSTSHHLNKLSITFLIGA